MKPRILYCGDTHLHDAAAYLAGLMTNWGWDFDYVASDTSCASELFDKEYELIICSDFPAEMLTEPVQQRVVERVQTGCGFLMIGGWESYHGLGGN